MPAKVSIIVPMYNVAPYVKKCLTSLTQQTFHDIKIYAISDGSPDDSFQIAQQCAQNDSRIICIEKDNGGYGSVLEYAIQHLDTEYFLICDPDDWLTPHAVETLYHEAQQHNLDLVIADKYTVQQSDHITTYCSSNSNIIPIKPNQTLTTELERLSFLAVSPHAKLYRTAITRHVIFPHHVQFTDFILYLTALTHANRAKYLPQPLAYYLLDRPGNSRTTSHTLNSIKQHVQVWQSTYQQISPNCSPYLYYRLYHEFKLTILQPYVQNSPRPFQDELAPSIHHLHQQLRNHRSDIYKLAKSLSFKQSVDVHLLLSSSHCLRLYTRRYQ